jgi:trigger factor
MKSEVKKLPKSQVEITIEVSLEEIKPFLEKAAKKLSKDLKFDGFRPGKAPYDVVEKKVGAMGIIDEAVNDIISETYYKILEKEKLMTLGQPEINIIKAAPNNPIEYKAVVATLPKVEVGDYSKIKVEKKKVEVKDEQVDKVIDDIRNMRAKEKLVKREAKTGDRLEIDFDVSLDKVVIEGGSHKKYPITIGESRFIPGFEEKLIGLKAGDDKEFKLKFPEKYHQKTLAGKECDFKVKCNGVYEREVAKLDDAFAKEVSNKQFKTLVDLKKNVRNNIEKDEENKANQRVEIEMLDKLVEISNFEDELPETLVKNETNKMLHEMEHNLTSQGMKFEDYLSGIKKTREDLEKEFEPQATQRAKTAIVAREIYQEKKFKVTDEEIQVEVAKMIAAYPDNPEAKKQLESPQYQEHLRNQLGNRKVIEFLKSEMIK